MECVDLNSLAGSRCAESSSGQSVRRRYRQATLAWRRPETNCPARSMKVCCGIMLLRLLCRLAFVLAVAVIAVPAQSAPRPLTHADFDSWRSIATPILSHDGQWLAYSLMPQDG